MDLRFPELMGGPVQGLNEAGVENFQGAVELYLARECGQNTGDARRPDVPTARLEFDLLELRPEEIPAFETLRATLSACRAKVAGKKKEQEFFDVALKVADGARIPVLKISDFGTTGLTGSDTDETGRWFALVKSQGISNKESTAGGSFGIGKSSPFASSRFRTVFYSTRTLEGAAALQGVSRLVTHNNAEGRPTQGVGFIGDYDPSGGEGGGPLFLAVRDEERIPEFFRRDQVGTDIWVIGYRGGGEWNEKLVHSILANFWPAIHRGSISFRVATQELAQSNLEEMIQRYAAREDFEAHHYFRALGSSPILKELRTVGRCSLYLTTASPELPKKVCMARGSGMRVYDYPPRACRVPFSGLFICTDDRGNELLRKLEPPRHDTWDPTRTEGLEGKRALDEIKLWIREEVKKLNPLFGGKSFNEAELAKYLPDLPATTADSPLEPALGTADEEGLEPRPKHPAATPAKIVTRPSAHAPGGKESGGVGAAGAGGRGAHGEGKQGEVAPPGGGSSEDQASPALLIRSYRSGPGEYVMVLRSSAPFSGKVMIKAVGEDGSMEVTDVQAAHPVGFPESRLTVSSGSIEGVELLAGVAVRLLLKVAPTVRHSLTAVAMR